MEALKGEIPIVQKLKQKKKRKVTAQRQGFLSSLVRLAN